MFSPKNLSINSVTSTIFGPSHETLFILIDEVLRDLMVIPKQWSNVGTFPLHSAQIHAPPEMSDVAQPLSSPELPRPAGTADESTELLNVLES